MSMFGPPKPVSEIMFDKFDTDKSGKIDLAEFKKLVFALGYALTDGELTLALKTLDEDGSGELQRKEFVNWWKKSDRWQLIQLDETELAKRQAAADSFNAFDADKSGAIEAKDFDAFYAAAVENKMTKESKADFLRKLDNSGDNKITFVEYINYLAASSVLLPQAK